MRRLLKFKYSEKDREVLVKYEIDGKASMPEIITLESHERPTPAVTLRLDAMAAHLVEIAELPEDWLDELTILGVTITHTDGVKGVVITATRALEESNAPLVLNSPHFTETEYSETGGNGKSIFSTECAEALKKLEKLVFAYVDGEEREQLKLELTEAPTAVLHGLS